MRDMKNFKDIKFIPHPIGSGIQGSLNVNGHTLSVVAGEGFYSSPRKNLTSPEDFESFEVAVFDGVGNFVTQKFLPNIGDDVAGWQTKMSINMLITRIETLTIS